MLLVYYVYSMWIFGFFPAYYFLRWGLIALASPLAAYIVWYSKGTGWTAALCAAMPISFVGFRRLFRFFICLAPLLELN
ncbi:hypothetical protein JQK62_25285, partial [Leptospira santarosai]|nr:hypothetical protein [Leptospira santarosai]